MDYTGKRFGRLVVIGKADKKHYLVCQCDCGNKTTVLQYNLTKKKNPTQSCGCYRREVASMVASNMIDSNLQACRELNRRYETNFQVIESKKLPKNNTSGKKGVSYREDIGRYEAYINARKKRFFLGLYDSYADAVNARLQAERILHKPLIKGKYSDLEAELKKLRTA